MSLLAFEWVKMRSLRSLPLVLLAGFLISVGLGLLSGLSTRAAIDSHNPMLRPDFDPLVAGFVTVLYGQLAFVAFGVVSVSSEFTSGTIRSSLAAVPMRGQFFRAKIAMVSLVALPVAAATTIASFLTIEFSLGPHGAPLNMGAVRALAGAVVYLILVSVLSAAVAAMLRSSALTLGVLILFFMVVSPALSVIPATHSIAHYLPDQAGIRMMTVETGSASAGLAVVVAWTAAALLGGYLMFRGRDV